MLDEIVFKEFKNIVKDKLPRLLKYYINDTYDNLEKIPDLLANKNIKEVCRIAHTIKSTSYQIGTIQVAKIAEELEEYCYVIENDDEKFEKEKIQNLYNDLKAEFELAVPLFGNI